MTEFKDWGWRRGKGETLYLILENPGLGWDWDGETPTAGDSCLDGSCSLVRGGLSILQFPPALDLLGPPTFTSSEKYSACSLIWCSRPSPPPPPLAQCERKVRELWETENSKTPDSGRRVSGKRRGFGDQERGEKGDERVRGNNRQGAA